MILWGAVVLALAPARAAPVESVTMPFECAVDGPRIVLKPSEPRGYTIQGGREERQVTACAASGSTDCRTLMAHRFQISCGGRRVSWMRVVAAASASSQRDIWVDAGRLHLALDRRGTANGCRYGSRASARRGGDEIRASRVGLPSAECLPWDRGRGVAHIVLPPGFAPLGEIGARILLGSPAQVADAAPAFPSTASTPPNPPLAMAALPSTAAAAPPEPPARVTPARVAPAMVTVEPLPDVAPIPVVLTGADASRSWVTLVRPEPAAVEPAFMSRSPTVSVWLMALMLAAIMAMFARTLYKRGMLRPQRVTASDARAGPEGQVGTEGNAPASGGGGGGFGAGFGQDVREALRKAAAGFGASAAPQRPAETSLANAAASVSALIEQANGSLGLLSSAPPLREVLEQEIGLIQQRLAIVKAQASDSPEAAHKAAPVFRTLVRDLERVRRISESAALSFSADHSTIRLPRTKSEAYGVLGVNADIGEATLKKLVDALRVCWHPDLAKDASDLAQREERIKIINVAWDLIVGKRASS